MSKGPDPTVQLWSLIRAFAFCIHSRPVLSIYLKKMAKKCLLMTGACLIQVNCMGTTSFENENDFFIQVFD